MRLQPGRGLGALASLLALALCGGAAAKPAPCSGRYGSMALVVHDGHVVAEGRGGAGGIPSFSCVFLLRGGRAGDSVAVETRYPSAVGRLTGRLAFMAEVAELTLAEDHGGYPMATGSMVGKPFALPREVPEVEEEPEGWRGVELVTARRAGLGSDPGPAPKCGPYFVADDPVVVLERRERWVRMLYGGSKAPVAGWAPAAELAVETP